MRNGRWVGVEPASLARRVVRGLVQPFVALGLVVLLVGMGVQLRLRAVPFTIEPA